MRIKDAFPGAQTNEELMETVDESLKKHGFGKTTLVCSSLCCDEVNRPLEKDLASLYGDYFSLGGLAGFPFGGLTGFGAMASHIPDGGSCLVAYGPHVGVDAAGRVGTVDRRGREKGGSCCGSAVAASAYVQGTCNGDIKPNLIPPEDPMDAQQFYVGSMLLPHATRLAAATNPMVELPYAMFDAQDKLMQEIITKSCGKVAGDGKIALLGGIQINTPAGFSDYFLPLRFDVYNSKGEMIDQLINLPSRVRLKMQATQIFARVG